MIARNL